MLNNLQKEVVESESEITIIAAARQQGGTTSLLLKCLTHGHKLFIDGYNTVDKGLVMSFMRIFEQHSPYEDLDIHKDIMLGGKRFIWNKGLSSITFIDSNIADRLLFMKPNVDMICVDNPEKFDKITMNLVNQSLNKSTMKQILFATNPFHCAYRNPEYVNGVIERDLETNLPLYKDYSWDKDYINWQKIDKESRGEVITKAYKHQYLPKVRVIHSENNCEYNGVLNWYDKQTLKGEWQDE